MFVCVCVFVFPVNVKWGKEKFDAVELNTEEPPMVFKAQLFALTGVQPDRQKVMVKGGTLKVRTRKQTVPELQHEAVCVHSLDKSLL